MRAEHLSSSAFQSFVILVLDMEDPEPKISENLQPYSSTVIVPFLHTGLLFNFFFRFLSWLRVLLHWLAAISSDYVADKYEDCMTYKSGRSGYNQTGYVPETTEERTVLLQVSKYHRNVKTK